MRKLLVSKFMTLDGVMQAPGGKDEDRDGGFEHGGWTMPYWHDDIGKTFLALMQEVDGIHATFGLKSATPYPSGVVGLHYARQRGAV
jgi:hypothetical protein